MKVNNRKCIRRLSCKSLWASRRRNIIAIAAIALTTLLFTSLFTIAMSMNASYQTYIFRQVGGYCHGTFKDVTDEQAAAISGHKKVKETGARKVIGFMMEGSFAKVPAEVSYMDPNCTKWSYAEPTVGHMPEQENEAAMDTGTLKLLGIEPKLGAEIPLTYMVGDKNQISSEKTATFVLSGYWDYDDVMPVHYINISKAYADKVEQESIAQGMEPFRTDLNVMMSSSVDIRGQMEQVDTDLGYTWEGFQGENNVRIGVNWGYTTSQLESGMDPLTVVAIAAFLLLVIFTGYLIIYNIFQISVSGDIRYYGLLKTIGLTPKQLRRIIRQQALFLCVIGIPAGMILGYAAGAVLVPVVMDVTTFGASSSTISASPVIFLASGLFSLATVLLSCARPGRIAGKVSPVEAAKYTENAQTKKKQRATRGAKVHQMAFANLGRNRSKTALVVVSLSLSVILFNLLYLFVSGFDMEKYLSNQTCADFIVSSTDYFRFNHSSEYITDDMIEQIRANTAADLGGSGYTTAQGTTKIWMSEEAWKAAFSYFIPEAEMQATIDSELHKGELIGASGLIEGLDPALFEKLNLVQGDLAPLFEENTHAIALVLEQDDYGNVSFSIPVPAIGDPLEVSYIEDFCYLDSRTGELCDENTPEEYLQFHIKSAQDVTYTVCAYVTVPYSMSYRYSNGGYCAVLPVDTLQKDSGQDVIPLYYLFDTPDENTEAAAEQFLSSWTAGETSPLMYESKATLRADFESFRNMFLLLGGLLCAIIGLVGILNFFNAIMTGILSRRREFAVLQAVGMTTGQLKAMLIYEGLFYALGSSFLALVLSALLNPLIGKLLEGMFWFFNARFTILPVLTAIPVFALLGWLIPSIMYRQTMRHSIVEQLRETE